MDFHDKRVLVTGGGRGIGRAISTAFAARGARVAVHYRSDEGSARRTLEALEGGPHAVLAADLADPEAARDLPGRAAEALGGLDVLVNNAGVFFDHPIDEAGFDAWRGAWERTLATNLLGPAHASWGAVRHMRERGGGRIVNVSSRGAFRGEPDAPAYGASKAGLNALTGSLARRLAPLGIFVGAVAPGFVDTDMAAGTLQGPAGDAIRAQSPLGRVARPEEVAHAVLFLASEGAEFSTGTIVDVNGASYLRQ